jgi:hypothetical protein
LKTVGTLKVWGSNPPSSSESKLVSGLLARPAKALVLL